jgi:hypothetical protein
MPATGPACGPGATTCENTMRTLLTLLAVGLVAGGLRADDGPVAIKIKQPGVGDTIKESRTERANNNITISIMGQNQAQAEKVEAKFVYTDEILERPAGAKQPTKVKRTYETAEMQGGPPGELGLAGKTVLIEKGSDGYKFSVDGKPVNTRAAELLGKEFSKNKQVGEEDFVPKDPVKVGGTWKIDVDKIAKEAGDELDVDAAKSSATGKLVKVYDKGGHKFGQIEVTMELALKKVGPAGRQIELKPGAKLAIRATLDMCIDGSTWAVAGKMTTTGKFAGSAMGADVTFDLNSVRDGDGAEVGKK